MKTFIVPKKTKKSLIYTICAVLMACACTAHAQANVDSATRSVDRSYREEAEREMTAPPPAPPKIVEEAEKPEKEGPKFLIKKINLDGVVSVSPDIFKPIIEKYEGKKKSLEEIKILCRQIEREYLRQGIISACYIPPQDVKNGVISLRVVEAKMGEVQVNEGEFYAKDRIFYYWDIKPGEILRYDKMSKSVQLMNKNPDRDVKATLHAGKKPGTTDVLLDVKTYFPIHGIFSFDREGSVSTGRDRIGFSVKDNNFLFVDDTLLVGYSFGKDFSGIYGYHSIPITNFGTSIMYGYSVSHSAPKKEFTPFVIRSRADNFSFYVQQDIYKKADYLGELSFGMDANDKVTTSNNGTLNRDRLRIARFKANLSHRHPGTLTYMTPQFSQGLNIFGARSKNVLSSRGADSTFSKFNLSIHHKRQLPFNMQASVKFKCQLASEKLNSQEQFSLGGLNSVRGYPAGDYLADTAFQTNCELLVPSFWIPEKIKLPYAPQTLKDSVTGVLFFDYGYGEKRGGTQGDKALDKLAGIGAGLRIRVYNQLLLRLEWGFPVGDKTITEAENSRFHISINFEDQFAREFERISKQMDEEHIKNAALKLVDLELQNPESLLNKKMSEYLNAAQIARKEGDLKRAHSLYAKVVKISNALYTQAEIYVRDTIEQRENLSNESALAMQYYNASNLLKARDLWKKIEKDAQTMPLVFEF